MRVLAGRGPRRGDRPAAIAGADLGVGRGVRARGDKARPGATVSREGRRVWAAMDS